LSFFFICFSVSSLSISPYPHTPWRVCFAAGH
jgi:hypothetical protein